MEINILGPVSLTMPRESGAIRAAKVRTLVATLALDAGRAVSHADLVDELWAANPPDNVLNALQAHATRARKVLASPGQAGGGQHGGVLRSVPGGYLLTVEPDRVDGNRFLRLVSQGAAAVPSEPRRAVELLEAGLGLWRGPALIDAGEGPRCRGAAALFEERRLAALEDLLSATLLLGGEAQAIARLQQLVAQYPLRERFCELLMIALYRAGRQGDALESYQRARKRLDDELGIQPGVRLRRRHAEILAQDPRLKQPAALRRATQDQADQADSGLLYA
ncbi:AfsR/SARP family transcriptional regulator [Streptomyces naganishii]|uniref:AfsR/SARP family transcriptional regulator n=1 Tax=Streptomyces naganishii TaxID=285447 RepID=UPI001E4EE9AC|nr:AfsR/SARP family transcriptional regulator [Streptomyces naganishii]